MKSSVPAPVVAAIIAIIVLVGGFLLWKKAGSSTGAGTSGDVQSLANEVKSKSAPDFTKEQASAGMVSGPKKGSAK